MGMLKPKFFFEKNNYFGKNYQLLVVGIVHIFQFILYSPYIHPLVVIGLM
jgi:hypothetical protein